jgi:hypothetical protein
MAGATANPADLRANDMEPVFSNALGNLIAGAVGGIARLVWGSGRRRPRLSVHEARRLEAVEHYLDASLRYLD